MSLGKVTVLAGSKPFTKALAGPIADRFGEAPRIAADPGQAFALCRSASGVLVFEYAASWMPVVKDLGRTTARLQMIAAVPPSIADAEPALRELGVVAVPWQGDPASLLDAMPGARPAAGPGATGFFGDVTAPVPVARSDAAGSAPAPVAAAAPLPAAPRPAHDGPAAWPATAPGEEDAEAILCAAFAGLSAAGDPALDAVLAGLTALERQALEADPAVADPVPLRRFAAIRYRIASALASTPAAGSPVDVAAGTAMLGEIDAALATLKGAADAYPDRGAELDAIRKALVKEAVDLSEALHRLQPAGAPAAPAVAARRSTTGAVRVDDAAATAVTAEVGRRRLGMWVTLALVLLAGGAFHAREYWVRQTRAESVRLTGVPAGFVGAPAAPGRPQVLLRAGPAPDPAEVDRFRKEQQARGYKVVELPSGGLMLVPPQANERPAAQKEAP